MQIESLVLLTWIMPLTLPDEKLENMSKLISNANSLSLIYISMIIVYLMVIFY